MTTDGGGWTLVYVYGFTNYNDFDNSNNAVTPRPTWPGATDCNVPVSTIPPTGPMSPGAINFTLWKSLGQKFLIKSNINNEVKCIPVVGSLFDWVTGSINCTMVNLFVSCPSGPSSVPITLLLYLNSGPHLQVNSFYYFFDCNTDTNWPTHNPCGEDDSNHKTGVTNPYGSIYLQ